jgi:hypothetical protein
MNTKKKLECYIVLYRSSFFGEKISIYSQYLFLPILFHFGPPFRDSFGKPTVSLVDVLLMVSKIDYHARHWHYYL